MKNEAELTEVFNGLKEKGVRCCAWMEEDLGGEMTAVATAPLRGEERRAMRRFRLLK